MQEYCCNFRCVSKNHCNDYEIGCSEIQCMFQYDCEACVYHNNCEGEEEEEEEEGEEEENT